MKKIGGSNWPSTCKASEWFSWLRALYPSTVSAPVPAEATGGNTHGYLTSLFSIITCVHGHERDVNTLRFSPDRNRFGNWLKWETELSNPDNDQDSESGAILEKFQQQDLSLMGRITGALTWSLYVWRFEGENLTHYSISLMLSWLAWSCSWIRVHQDYPRIRLAHFCATSKFHQTFNLHLAGPTSAPVHGHLRHAIPNVTCLIFLILHPYFQTLIFKSSFQITLTLPTLFIRPCHL